MGIDVCIVPDKYMDNIGTRLKAINKNNLAATSSLKV